MKIVIVGAGKVGEALVVNFLSEGHDIVVLDVKGNAVSSIVNRYDVRGVIGSGTERASLNDAEVESADFFIACTSRDETNILSCAFARKLGAKRTIARVRDPEYFREKESLKDILGLDFAFNPEFETAREICQRLKFPSAKNVESFVSNKVAMVEFEIGEESPLVNKSLREIAREYGGKVLISVVQRGKECYIPQGDFVIEKGDRIHVISSDSDINVFCRKVKIYKRRSKNVLISGGGKVGYYLAEELAKLAISVKMIEKDQARAEELANSLPKVTVILGDGTDQTLLDEENLKGNDAFVALTGMDEENVITSLYAVQRGVNRVVTKVDNQNIISMAEKLGLDAVVSPKDIIANQIVSFVRAHQAETSSGINTFYKLYDKVEALEFLVAENFNKQGVPLKMLNLKRNVLIAGIVRNEEFILPSGDSCFISGDRVIVVAASKQISDLSQILR